VKIGVKSNVHFGKPQAKCKVSLTFELVVFHYSQLIKQAPKSKVAKAVKEATVKKRALNSEEECVIDKPAARYFDIAQECLNDDRWKRVFLQTLSHKLYISEHPFKDWAWGSGSIRKTVQAVFDISFTNISYTVTTQDRLLKAVCHVA
jgi:hypothetical protein